MPLEKFLAKNELGEIKQLTPITWIWKPTGEQILRARPLLIKAGLTVVTE
jgi:hypothetical protein